MHIFNSFSSPITRVSEEGKEEGDGDGFEARLGGKGGSGDGSGGESVQRRPRDSKRGAGLTRELSSRMHIFNSFSSSTSFHHVVGAARDDINKKRRRYSAPSSDAFKLEISAHGRMPRNRELTSFPSDDDGGAMAGAGLRTESKYRNERIICEDDGGVRILRVQVRGVWNGLVACGLRRPPLMDRADNRLSATTNTL